MSYGNTMPRPIGYALPLKDAELYNLLPSVFPRDHPVYRSLNGYPSFTSFKYQLPISHARCVNNFMIHYYHYKQPIKRVKTKLPSFEAPPPSHRASGFNSESDRLMLAQDQLPSSDCLTSASYH